MSTAKCTEFGQPVVRRHTNATAYRSTPVLLILCTAAAVCALVFGGQVLRAENPKPQAAENQESKAVPQPQKKPFSPLHSLVGIDPETGQFVSPSERPRESTSGREAKDSPDEGTAGTPAEAMPIGPEDEAARALREFAGQLENLQAGEEGPLSVLSAYLEGSHSSPLWDWHRHMIWLAAGLFLLYPLGMIVSETISFLWGSRQVEATESDRRYAKTRLRRRIALATAIASLVVLASFATTNPALWSSPTTLSLLGILGMILSVAVVTLSGLIKTAARDRTLDIMREIRQNQFELRKDVDELRKRMRQVTING